MSNRFYELSYFHYLASKYKRRRVNDDVGSLVGNESIDGIELVNG